MPNKIELLLEAEKRGVIDAKNQALLSEARKRGLVQAPLGFKGKSTEDIIATQAEEDLITKQRNIQRGKELAVEQGPEELGGTIGGLIGKTPGAAFGGGVGRVLSQLYLKSKDSEKAPESIGGALKEISISAGRQAAFEKGGQLVAKGVGKVISPFGKTVTPEGKAASDLIEAKMPMAKGWLSKRLGLKQVGVTPAEMTESRTLDILQNITESSLIGGSKLQKLKKIVRPKILSYERGIINDITKQFDAKFSPEIVADLFETILKGNLKTARIPAKIMYNSVDDLVKPVYKNVPVKEMVQSIMVDASGKPLMRPITTYTKKQVGGASVSVLGLKNDIAKNAAILETLFKEGPSLQAAKSGDQLIDMVQGLKDNIPFDAAQELRSRLLDLKEEIGFTGKKIKAFGTVNRLIATLDKSIRGELKKVDPKALDLWNRANKLWADTSGKYKTDFIKSLLNLKSTQKNLFTSKAFASAESASQLKSILTEYGHDKFYDTFGRPWIDNLLHQSFEAGSQIIKGDVLYDNLFGKNALKKGFDEKVLVSLFGKEKVKLLKETTMALQQISFKQASGTGGMAIQLAQPAAAFAIFAGTADKLAATILGGPAVLGRLLVNPTFKKYLVNAAKLPKGSAQLFSLIGRINHLAYKTYQEMKKNHELPITNREIQALRGQSTLDGPSVPKLLKDLLRGKKQ